MSKVIENLSGIDMGLRIGKKAHVTFGDAGIIISCWIIKAHVGESFLSYDLAVLMSRDDNEKLNWGRLYNVPNALVILDRIQEPIPSAK